MDASWFKQLENDSCVLCRWSRVIKRVCILCEGKNEEEGKISKDYEEFIEECKTSLMERHFAQQELRAMHEEGCLHGEKQNNTTPSPAPGQPLPPHSIDMHSWPGRCKNRLAVPELEMVTECRLQLLGF